MQPFDDFEIDIRIACCENVAAERRDDINRRRMFIAPAIGSILADEPADLNDLQSCRMALARFFAATDIEAMLGEAVVAARATIENRKAAA